MISYKYHQRVATSAFVESFRRWLVSIYELPQDNSRIVSLEGIRGLAITLVFFVHYHALFSHYLANDSASFSMSHFSWSIGPAGVDLFFILSGYLIYGIVMQKNTNYLKFMFRRAQRIYPTFLFVLALYIILLFIFPRETKLPSDPGEAALLILENVALLPGIFNINPIITVAWSLSYEWFFYACIPILISVLKMKRWKASSRILFIAISSVAYITLRLPPNHMPMFASGMLLYELSNSVWFKSKLSRTGEVFAIAVFIATFPCIYFLQSRQSGPDPGTVLWDWSVIAILYGGFFWFFVYAINYDGIVKRSLSCTPLRWLGNISYSYYLLHGLVLNAIALALKSVPGLSQYGLIIFWIGLPLAFLTTVGISTVLFVEVERRFSIFKKPAAPVRSLSFGSSA